MYVNNYTKIRIGKNAVEFRGYEHLNVTGKKNCTGVERTPEEKERHYDWRQDQKAENIRRLIEINFQNDNSIFVTLTFAEEPTTVEDANCIFKKFVRQLKRKYDNLLYVAVLEKGEQGRFHYHAIFNIKYSNIAEADIIKAWKWGNEVDVQNVYDFKHLGFYITKSSNSVNDELYRKRRFLHAKELKKEIIVQSWDDTKEVDKIRKQVSEESFFSAYAFQHEQSGYVNVSIYNQNLKLYGEYVYATRKK